MIPSLSSCFTGPFVWYKDGLALSGEHDDPIAGRDLLDGNVVQEVLHRYGKAYPGADRRAIVSMWTQWHFGILIVPATAAVLLLNRDLPLDLDRVGVALNDEGRTASIILPDEGETRRAESPGRFSRLFDEHIEPLVDHFSACFCVSRRLLWTNAASAFEWALQQAEVLNACPAALAEGRALLHSRTAPTGRSNPMFGTILCCEEQGERMRKRKVCCLRYLLPGFEDCGALCPLPADKRA